ncbi:DEP domain-containing protein 7-like [Gouania willdenowi]|uniref:DEP domain-containing protein 7-like n=1 Tax=Gouania willdenowi TaxID=441366 RepID=UPI0010549775|nr:DEP domain-containing protein 7-like [Gouania willdenowi]
MSTIKERAAALNLAQKLCVRPLAISVATKPAQASSIWSALIAHLRSTVTVKRRRVHLKSHSDCFLGSEAVDVLEQQISHVRGANVSRDKVVCVCQALLECNVFDAVGTKVFGKDKKRDAFQDSKSSLYRFVAGCTPSVDELERGPLGNGIQKLFCSAEPDRQMEQTCPTGPHVELLHLTPSPTHTNPMKTVVSTKLSVEPLVDSLSPNRSHTDAILPQSLVDEVWQEHTLLRLLNLVDLPLLDGVLQCSQKPASPVTVLPLHTNPQLICSSNHLDRQILKAFKDSQEDQWLCAALDCLDFLPDQPVVELSRELPHCVPYDGINLSSSGHSSDDQISLSPSSLAQCKMLLYETLVKHYSNANKPPLLPQHMADIYTAITDLLVKAKMNKALEALQLSLKLLPHSYREELRRLLRFMSLAADPKEMKVDQEVENRLVVNRAFSRAILHSKVLSKQSEDLLLVFMLSNITEIFKIPGALHKEVSEKLASLVQGKQPDVAGRPFSQQISSRTYTDSTKKTTKEELWNLLDNIHLDPNMSTKERKKLLRQFNQAHPQIFHQYFGDTAASVI